MTDQNIYYVVRTKRKGKFVRAFLSRSQAVSWCEREPNWTWAEEQAHEKDSDGRVFHLYKKYE